MKKIIMLLLAVIMLFANCTPSLALESGVSEFSITPIRANQKDKYIKINVTAPSIQANSKMLVAFYIDGKLTSLTPIDISSNTKISDKQISTGGLVKDPNGNYYEDLTPEKIKIFTWDQTTLKPKTLCDNVLTKEVIDKANEEVVEMLKIIPEATQFIRENHLTWESDVEDGIADSWDTHLFPIMDYIDLCAEGALEDAESHLLTSLFAQERYKDELNNIRRLFSQAPAEQKSKITDLINATKLGKDYYNALDSAMKFLDFSLTNT